MELVEYGKVGTLLLLYFASFIQAALERRLSGIIKSTFKSVAFMQFYQFLDSCGFEVAP